MNEQEYISSQSRSHAFYYAARVQDVGVIGPSSASIWELALVESADDYDWISKQRQGKDNNDQRQILLGNRSCFSLYI